LGLRVVDAAAGTAPRLVWSVGALVRAVGDALAARFVTVAVEGELAGFTRAASGHCYFTLKDPAGGAVLRAAMFRRAAALLQELPRDGQRVEVRGRLGVYEARGELQLVAESLKPAGEGTLYEQFLRLKARLEAEGLFDAARKRALPAFPRRIGIVTSTAAAALHDVLVTLARRAPHVPVVVYPAPVQGAAAPPALAEAIASAGRRAEVDLLLVCRGGGSLEDLWAFNDERVVRAIAACALPVVCGVGHETDVTLADFAADLRAPTPTAAAELAVPATAELLAGLQAIAGVLADRIGARLDQAAQRLDRMQLRLARPAVVLHEHTRRLDRLADRAGHALRRAVEQRALRLDVLPPRLARALQTLLAHRVQRLEGAAQRLAGIDPQRVLARGYAWLADAQGRPIGSAAALAPGDAVRAVLADGEADLRVDAVRPAPQQP
jgi:exodeoxyribonuclease VII large subunit